MRAMGTAAICLAMAVPGAAALSAPQPSPALQGEHQPGRYSTEWGEATVTFGDRGSATIKFADGSEIWGNFTVGGSGRFIGHWIRSRLRAGGVDPSGVQWASRCDSGPPVLPAGSTDRQTRYWGTALVTFRRGEFTAYFNSCRGLPHSTGSQREGLHGRLLTQVGNYAPKIIGRDLGRDWLQKSLQPRQIPCYAQERTVAFLADCEVRRGTTHRLIVQRDLQPGYHIRFIPLVSNLPAVGDALSRGQRPPARTSVAPIRRGFTTTTVQRRGTTIPFSHTPEMCRSDLWLVEFVTERGGAYPHSGVFLSDCGPRDGGFRPSGPAK